MFNTQVIGQVPPGSLGSSQTVTITGGGAGALSGAGLYTLAAASGVTDNLDSVTGLSAGDMVIMFADSGDTITVRHNQGGGNIRTAEGASLTLTGNRYIFGIYDGTNLRCDVTEVS